MGPDRFCEWKQDTETVRLMPISFLVIFEFLQKSLVLADFKILIFAEEKKFHFHGFRLSKNFFPQIDQTFRQTTYIDHMSTLGTCAEVVPDMSCVGILHGVMIHTIRARSDMFLASRR